MSLKIKKTEEEINTSINLSYRKLDIMRNKVMNPRLTQVEKNILMSDYYEEKGAMEALKWVLGEAV